MNRSVTTKRMSLRHKLTMVIALVSVVCVLAASIVVGLWVGFAFRERVVADIGAQTEVLAVTLAAAVAFEDEDAALRILDAFRARPSVLSVHIHCTDGAVFAAWTRDGSSEPPSDATVQPVLSAGDTFVDELLQTSRPIIMGDEAIGVLHVRSDLRELSYVKEAALAAIGIIVLVALLLALYLSARLAGVVSGPILRLASVAHQISNSADYSLRVEVEGDAEVVQLGEAFNQMLVTVEKADAELKASERNYREIFASVGEGLLVIDPDEDEIVDANPAALAMLQTTKDALLGSRFFAVIQADEDSALRGCCVRARAQGPQLCEHTISLLDEDIVMEVTVQLAEIGAKNRLMVMLRDLSVRRRLERQLRQSQKLEALGTLAGGIAHDFNNLLAVIVGSAGLAKDLLHTDTIADAEDDLHEEIDQIALAASRASELVRQILALSRAERFPAQPVDVVAVAEEVVKLLKSSAPKSIELVATLESVKTVFAEPSRLHQVLMNLCTNAVHAMEFGGRLELTVRDVAMRAVPGLADGDYVKIAVGDSGHGIPARNLDRIFDPYFTTKPHGKGTGLGLAVVHGIISALGGTVGVETEVGHGTTITVLLPASKKIVDVPTRATDALPSGPEVIMVIDDEPMVGATCERTLSRLGYDVSVFDAPRDALRAFSQDPGRFDLILTDLSMPEIDGLQVVRDVRAMRDNVPIVLMTGYLDAADSSDIAVTGIAQTLTKPFSRRELAETVRAALDARPGHVRALNAT